MALHRRVVADSDDSDDSDDNNEEAVTQDYHDANNDSHGEPTTLPLSTPQAEPLSPEHQPCYGQEQEQARGQVTTAKAEGGSSSGSTSQSAFARICSAHLQDKVQQQHQQQSRLIENIVRQSQRAVGSSSGGGGGSSSGAHQVVLEAPPLSSLPHQEGKEERDSWHMAAPASCAEPNGGSRAGAQGHDEWEIPSSPEAAGRTVMASGRSGRTSKTARILGNAEKGDIDDGGADELWDLPALPPPKRQRVSLHDTTGDSGKAFYVAPSHLTTMQKLEYQRVSVPGSAANQEARGTPATQQPPPHKSSGATTIAYSTPSRYASSGRYPWESSMIQEEQAGAGPGVINISSSPKIDAQERSSPVPQRNIDTYEDAQEDAHESPLRSSTRTSARKRRTPRKAPSDEDVDELAGDDAVWAFEGAEEQEEMYKPKLSRRRAKAASPIKDDSVSRKERLQVDVDHEEDELALEHNDEPKSARGRKQRPEIEEPRDEDEPPKAAAVPKKRGRPKKHREVVELPLEATIVADEADHHPVEESHNDQFTELAADEIPEPPKKKRGRPRKSDIAKASGITGRSTEAKEVAVPDDDTTESKPAVETKISKGGTRVPSPQRSPLEAKDANAASPPQKPQEERDRLAIEKTAKATTTTKLPTTPQPQSLYRVGLSKKSRIAPLLKMIRK